MAADPILSQGTPVHLILHPRPKLSLPVSEAATELGVSRQMLEKLIRAGQVKCHMLQKGGERRISYAELVRCVDARESAGMDG